MNTLLKAFLIALIDVAAPEMKQLLGIVRQDPALTDAQVIAHLRANVAEGVAEGQAFLDETAGKQ